VAPADAGIFLFLALNAHFEIQIDAEVFRLRIGAGAVCTTTRYGSPAGNAVLEMKPVAVFSRSSLTFPLAGSAVTVTTCARIDRLQSGIVESDFNLAVTGDEEFGLLGSDSRSRPPLGPATIFSAWSEAAAQRAATANVMYFSFIGFGFYGLNKQKVAPVRSNRRRVWLRDFERSFTVSTPGRRLSIQS
jgi:hypothetical protein